MDATLVYMGQEVTFLAPSTACRYLGVWGTGAPTGDMSNMKERIFKRTEEARDLLRHHPLTPEQAIDLFTSIDIGGNTGIKLVSLGDGATVSFRVNQIQTIQTATFGRFSFFLSGFDPGSVGLEYFRLTPHLARAMVLLDASVIARNVGRDLVFPASRRAACSHSDLGSCKPRILRFHTRARSHTRFWGRKQDGRWGQKPRYPRLGPRLNV